MTALKLLEELERQIIEWGYVNANTTLLFKIKDAIKELENKSCDGCKYYVQINKSDSFVCSLCLDCSRKYKPKDRFEPKDKQ